MLPPVVGVVLLHLVEALIQRPMSSAWLSSGIAVRPTVTPQTHPFLESFPNRVEKDQEEEWAQVSPWQTQCHMGNCCDLLPLSSLALYLAPLYRTWRRRRNFSGFSSSHLVIHCRSQVSKACAKCHIRGILSMARAVHISARMT